MNFLLILSRWVQQVCLGIWIGGLLVIGAIVAPVAFRHAGLDLEHAGNVVGNSFTRFNVVCAVTGALLLFGQAVEWAMLRQTSAKWRKLAGLRLLCVAGMLTLTAYLGGSVGPKMFADRAAGRKAAFDAAHRFYGNMARVQVYLAFGAVLFTVLLGMEETARARGALSGEPIPRDREPSVR
jgi:uncharacterized membrane protein